jgi:hypothetical protein
MKTAAIGVIPWIDFTRHLQGVQAMSLSKTSRSLPRILPTNAGANALERGENATGSTTSTRPPNKAGRDFLRTGETA